MSDRVCRRLRIHGAVQGVGFRYSLQHEALRLGVAGWVRNRRDGTVEAVVSGTAAAIESIVAWSRHGPPSARVGEVEVCPESGEFRGFEARPTE